MFYNSIDPVLFRLGSLEVRYYGIIYALSFIIAYFMIYHLAKKGKLKITKDDAADFVFYLLIGTVIGARIFYVIFYDPAYFISNPFMIPAVWHGGLSFHGGLVGAIIAGFLFCRKKKISFYEIADIAVIPLALGLFLGRIANFINGELVGRIANVPWCVKFQNFEGCRHPSQIYEAVKNLFMFFVLWFVYALKTKGKKLPSGFLFWLFVVMYSVLRFFMEFFRRVYPGEVKRLLLNEPTSFSSDILGVGAFEGTDPRDIRDRIKIPAEDVTWRGERKDLLNSILAWEKKIKKG
ncbi:prolipoprotein diacylglyceryl transferase [Candidatus Woesearchaeota archaeon]|nr:prolipoprotein diacylglyceryl transferase [Candidatus Woesearchaeota archaeon]